MLHLPVDPRALYACGRAHRLLDNTHSVELGYLVHSLLSRLWGAAAPKPFDVPDPSPRSGQKLGVLAYAGEALPALLARAQASADADALGAIDWDRAGAKPMPDLAAGQRVGFRVRVCPTVRVGRQHPRFGHGAEIDPYLAGIERELALREAAAPGVPVDRLKAEVMAGAPTRETVYREWLAARLGSAARLDATTRLVLLRDARLWRRGLPGEGAAARMHGHARPRFGERAMLGRREAVFEGTLEVCDAALFAALLARGVGRHRSFGFGMMLLRPATDGPC
jgi:CRISPR system Cascade subunit CasE